jgi:hypothetical protein
MKRISIFIREDQFKSINRISKDKDISSAELIREAIDSKLLSESSTVTKEEVILKTKGMLKESIKEDVKSEEVTDAIRKEWEKRVGRNNK